MHIFLNLLFALIPLFLFGQNQDENEITKINQQYEEAFNKHDVKAISKFWAEDASFSNPISGAVVTGRDAIANELKSWFAEAKVDKVDVKDTKISFPEPNKAIETGVFHLTYLDNKPSKEKAFRAELEKQNGKWLYKVVRQIDLEPNITHYEELKQLEWLIGNWKDEDKDVNFTSQNAWWDKYKNYISQIFSFTAFGQKTIEGQQFIGWDPDRKQIRSWAFDTDGGFGHGIWYKKGDNWFVDTQYILPDGRRASAIHVYKKLDNDTYTWASEGRDIGGEILPNITPIKIVRTQGVQ